MLHCTGALQHDCAVTAPPKSFLDSEHILTLSLYILQQYCHTLLYLIPPSTTLPQSFPLSSLASLSPCRYHPGLAVPAIHIPPTSRHRLVPGVADVSRTTSRCANKSRENRSMLEQSESPPPLHHSPATSDQSRFPSRDSTPATPLGIASQATRKPTKERDILSWFRRPVEKSKTTTSLCLDTSPLEPDFDDHSFPLFGASPPDGGMATATTPINIRHSTSPRSPQSSNLTAALQRSSSSENKVPQTIDLDGMNDKDLTNGNAAEEPYVKHEDGAKPISMKGVYGDKNRRESLAQSLGTGMSWGGVSVGSWIRDEYVLAYRSFAEADRTDSVHSIMMTGTSPFAFQSPSYHSSSYLPKLEANFMRDFYCCGLTLPTLHDLLQHYEEAHAQKPSEVSQVAGRQQPPVPDARAAIATNTAAAVQQQAEQQRRQEQLASAARAHGSSHHGHQSHNRPPTFSSTLQTIPDMDTVEDMEMDDVDATPEQSSPTHLFTSPKSQQSPPMQFSSAKQPQIPQLNTSMMQGHQAFRNSTPNTPIAPGRNAAPFQNTSAGQNTPTLMNNPMQQQFQGLQDPSHITPETSLPGTPGEIDDGIIGGMDGMSMQSQLFNSQTGLNDFGLFGNNDMLDLCIDEPAKRLFTPGGGQQSHQHQSGHARLGSGQYGPNSDIAKRIREQQMAAGLPDTTTGILPHEEPKPFRCPVIGCEKAYKNQNGLKYHKAVSRRALC